MLKVGITGSIASGKTTVSILIRRRSFAVFNSDNYAKMARHQGNECFRALKDVLGDDVIGTDGDIDAKKMAAIIFHDEEKRNQVNAVVHPFVLKGIERFFESHQDDLIVFSEVPLLYEAHLESYFDKVILVTCDKDVAMKRMMEDRGYTESEAESRYVTQLDPKIKKEKADIVILNNGDLKELDHVVNQAIAQLRREARNADRS